MTTQYHEGELAVQARAGVQGMAARVGRSIAPQLIPQFIPFLTRQDQLVLAAADGQGRLWATLIRGEVGFIAASNLSTLVLQAVLEPGDPAAGQLQPGTAVGLLSIDFSHRQRVRINGTLTSLEPLTLHIKQAYGNCPKHIQRRTSTAQTGPAETHTERTPHLTPEAIGIVRAADTFFVATVHLTQGADASHRGGPAGFVRVVGPDRLEWPDYPGNTMFNTLGNIEATGRAGLLFIDFDRDRLLHLTGTAQIVWDGERLQDHPGAERVVGFTVEQAVLHSPASRRKWTTAPPD